MVESDRGFQQGRLALDGLCAREQPLATYDPRIKLFPGEDLQPDPSGLLFVRGRYGLALTLDNDPQVPVAQCGFDLREEELVITNTPQGLTRERLNTFPEEKVRDVLRELRKGNFRSELIAAIIALGRSFTAVGIERIRGIAAEHHDKVDVNGGPLGFNQALKSMNMLYETTGFTRDETGDYFLLL